MNYTLGLYEKAMPENFSLGEKLSCAKKHGFDFVELSIDESDKKLSRLDWGKNEIKDLKLKADETGIYFKSICLSAHRKYPLGSENPETARKSVEILKKAVLFAYNSGIRIIQLAGYDVYYEKSNEKTRENFYENLKICVDFAAMYGVMLAFETMETPFMNTVEKAMAYVKAIDSPYLKVYPDAGNLTNSGSDTETDIMKGKGNIAAAHLKETKPGIFRECIFGEGHVDFEKAISAFKKCGVRSYLAEMWCTDGEWETNIKNAAVFLRSKLDLYYEK